MMKSLVLQAASRQTLGRRVARPGEKMRAIPHRKWPVVGDYRG